MKETTKSSLEVTSSEITAGRDVVFEGGSEYRIGGDLYNIEVLPPSGTKVSSLQKSLTSNRLSLKEDLIELEKLVKKGLRLSHGRIRAVIKDIIISGKNIDLLIPKIRLDGGSAKSLPFESDIVNRINNSIVKGQKIFKEKELIELLAELHIAENDLNNVKGWKIFRSSERRKVEVDTASIIVEQLTGKIEYVKSFLAHCERIMEYEDVEIPIDSLSESTESIKSAKIKVDKTKSDLDQKKPKSKSKLKGTMLKKRK